MLTFTTGLVDTSSYLGLGHVFTSNQTGNTLRKLDEQFGRIERARRFAPRPYKMVVLSDDGQTQGMTFKQRNGYGLDDLVERSLEPGSVSGMGAGDEHDHAVGQAVNEATGRTPDREPEKQLADHRAIVLGSGNLGLVYLGEEKRRLTVEEIQERHPKLLKGAGRASPCRLPARPLG